MIANIAAKVAVVTQSLAALFGVTITNFFNDALEARNGVELKFAVNNFLIFGLTNSALKNAVSDSDGAGQLVFILRRTKTVTFMLTNNGHGLWSADVVLSVLAVEESGSWLAD